MTTLAHAVTTISQKTWSLSAPLADSTTHLQVDSEIVAVTNLTTRQSMFVAENPLQCRVKRGQAGTTAVTHSQGATVTELIDPNFAGPGGGGVSVTDGTTTVAATEIQVPTGMVVDAGGGSASVVGGSGQGMRVTSTGADDADASTRAVSDDGDALADNGATSNGDGNADARSGATTAGLGDAIATSNATAYGEGSATADVNATSIGGGATSTNLTADSQGSGNANANISATAEGNGNATGLVAVAALGTGQAQTGIIAARGATELSWMLKVDSGGVHLVAVGIPTADPHVVGEVWNSSGTLKVSAG